MSVSMSASRGREERQKSADASPVHWGILSTARICRRIVPALLSATTTTDSVACGTLVAVGSRQDVATVQQSVQQWYTACNSNSATNLDITSYQQVLENPTVEAIYIPLPNALHEHWTIQAIRHKKHVLVEKPLAMSVQEAENIFREADKHGVVVAEALMYRHHPQTIAVKNTMHEKLGTLRLIRATFHAPVSDKKNIRLQKGLGGGALFDLGIYPVSYAQFLMDGLKPYKVFATWIQSGESKDQDSEQVDTLITAQLHYRYQHTEVFMQMSCSFDLPYQSQFEIHGTGGRILVTRPFTYLDRPDRKVWFTPNIPETQPEEVTLDRVHQDLYVGQFIDMYHAIRDKTYSSLVSKENSLDHIRTLDALERSARLNQVVDL